MRVGFGYDVHRLTPGRPLILGGVTVPYALGLAGHSDADVLTHAVMDALLGAAALGDIGRLFPPADQRWENISSLLLLEKVVTTLKTHGYQIINIDSVIQAEQPKLAGYIPAMRMELAQRLQLETDAVSIKATTTEGLGFIGGGQGIAAQAVALITKSINPDI